MQKKRKPGTGTVLASRFLEEQARSPSLAGDGGRS